MTPAQEVAANVRSEAARRRISQKQLAKALGMSQQMLSQRMLGRIAFNVNELTAVANFLEIPVSHLHCEPSHV
ncbi:helix-turn-helix transcriptional regulator [Rhodococcus sp. IEGM 1409]|uniref:helix-turn-helix domain-containing protein n=1 Tax=Rhodococcus sp. IEGM 1409 TaxID=3047082 RepID=UPI0024B72308|nr:helix-turn-helix transcriptional regulator [Rhodococcus sp. IEGM 1409]MDI9901346.1 helix-turn-helix transcriptional regulator [Rhodococcus sp. IEGM 1409]